MNDIDVIIPLYNGEKWIKQTIESVLNQSIQPQNIIVVDDGSTDEPVKNACDYKEITLLHNPDPGSPSRARNYGLQHSSAPMVAFLDQDDVLHPDHFKCLCQILTEHPDVAAAAALYELFKDGGSPRFNLQEQKTERIEEWDIYPFADSMEPSLILYHRWVFDKLQWSDSMDGSSDRYLWHQILVHYPIIRLHAKTVARRVHSNSYYHRIIKEHPVAFFERLARVADHLLEYHLKYINEPQKVNNLRSRAQILHHLINLANGIIAQDHKAFRIQAKQLEDILVIENSYIREKTFDQFFLFMAHHNQGISAELSSNDFYTFVCVYWPWSCRVTRDIIYSKIIRRRLGIKFYLRNIVRHPFKLSCYALLIRVLKEKCGMLNNKTRTA